MLPIAAALAATDVATGKGVSRYYVATELLRDIQYVVDFGKKIEDPRLVLDALSLKANVAMGLIDA